MQNQRFQSRWKIDQFLAVFDEDKAVLLGRVEDLSTTGMCVVSQGSIPIGNTIVAAVEILLDNGTEETFYVRARSLWIRVDEKHPEYYKIGFRFLGPAPYIVNKIQHIIDHQQFPKSA